MRAISCARLSWCRSAVGVMAKFVAVCNCCCFSVDGLSSTFIVVVGYAVCERGGRG